MARRKSTRSYFEPWVAAKSKIAGANPFEDGIPEGADLDAAQRVIEGCERLNEHAEWVLWGSRMAEPTIVKTLGSGQAQAMDDRRIIAVRRGLGLPEGSPTNEEVARRICECVNALEGVADPKLFMRDVRDLLLEYVNGEGPDPREDNRVISLISRCIPADQREGLQDGYSRC